jgi:hypothetical protein
MKIHTRMITCVFQKSLNVTIGITSGLGELLGANKNNVPIR